MDRFVCPTRVTQTDQFNASDSDDIELWTEDVYPDIFDEWNDAENYENFYTETTFYGSEL